MNIFYKTPTGLLTIKKFMDGRMMSFAWHSQKRGTKYQRNSPDLDSSKKCHACNQEKSIKTMACGEILLFGGVNPLLQ